MFCLSFLSLFLLRDTVQANRTPHPPRTCCCFFFLSVPAALSRSPVLAVRPFCSGVSSGCHSGPRAVLVSLGTALRPFFGRESGRGVCSFFGVLFFPFCGSHISRGPCACLQVGGPAGGLARSPCLSEGKGSNALLGRRGSDPLLFGSFFVASVCLGHRGP